MNPVQTMESSCVSTLGDRPGTTREREAVHIVVSGCPAVHTMCISCFTCCCGQTSDKKGNSEEKGFILPNGLRGNTVHHGQEAQEPECEGGGHMCPSKGSW